MPGRPLTSRILWLVPLETLCSPSSIHVNAGQSPAEETTIIALNTPRNKICACLPNRELITSEIIYWLYQVLTGKDSELLAWPAATALTTKRKQLGLGSGTLQDWIQELLKKVVFKVCHRPASIICTCNVRF